MTVANVTEFSNAVTIGNDVAAVSAPAFVKTNVMVNLMHAEGLPVGTMTRKFPKDGSLVAAAVAESTALSLSSDTEYTETSATATIAKAALTSGLSVEAAQFTSLDLAKLGRQQFQAIARYVDNDALSLMSSITHAVTGSGPSHTLTVEDLITGQFNIFNSDCPNPEVMLQAVLCSKALANLKTQIVQTAGSAWQNSAFLDIMMGQPQPNGRVGNIPGICDVYKTSGFALSGSDAVQAIFHPMWTFAGCFAPSPVSWLIQVGAGGLYWELTSHYFYDVLLYNDYAGCEIDSLA